MHRERHLLSSESGHKTDNVVQKEGITWNKESSLDGGDGAPEHFMVDGLAMRRRLYGLARRLSVGRSLRYLELWVHYLWQLLRSNRATDRGPRADAELLSAVRVNADMATAKRIAVRSWNSDVLDNAEPPLRDDKTDTSQPFSGPFRQMVYLSLHPETFDLSV